MRTSTAVLLTAALAASSTFAAPLSRRAEESSLAARGGFGHVVEALAKHIEEHKEAYKVLGNAAHSVMQSVSGRSIEDDDVIVLSERDIEDLLELDERELNDVLEGLDERSLFSIVERIGAKILHHGAHHAASNAGNNNNNNQHRRSLEDDDEDLTERDLDDIDELDERELDDDFDDLDERNFLTGIIGKLVKHGAKHGAENAANNAANNQQQQQPPNQQRSLEDIDDEVDFTSRSVPVDELEFDMDFTARSVPVEELEFESPDARDVDGAEVEMRDLVDGEAELEGRNGFTKFLGKIGKTIKKGLGFIGL